MFKTILVLSAGLILLSVTGCGVLPIPGTNPAATPTNIVIPAPTNLPAPTALPTATTAPATATPNPAANPLDALKKVFSGWGSVKSFRGQVVRTGGVAPGDSTFEMVLPDRIHTVSKTSEVIIIGKTIYTKKGATWTKQTLPESFDLSFADYKKILDQLGTATEVKFIGPDVFDNAPMLVYQYTFTTKIQNTTITTISKTWVAADGLPRKSESTSSINPGGKTTVTYSNYNDPTIVIEPPIK